MPLDQIPLPTMSTRSRTCATAARYDDRSSRGDAPEANARPFCKNWLEFVDSNNRRPGARAARDCCGLETPDFCQILARYLIFIPIYGSWPLTQPIMPF